MEYFSYLCGMKQVELLSPAKNLEVGMAAIDAGADAVYIGGPAFGARKAAGNSLDDIGELCRYAHLFGARVLVTLNTLLRNEDELQEAIRLAYAYKYIGVDALIIQDLRLANILFQSGDFSGSTRLHASTQCDNRSLERVQQLEAMGFKRVVLARELSLEQMRHIREHTTCELEAFIHGALCVSYSGACYLSEACCGRSANRGECAQMCRLPYDVLDENMQELLHQKHILSLYDLDRSQHLREMIEAGISTFKIEGRLKDIDYVRNITAYYRQLIDQLEQEGICRRTSHGICRCTFTPNPEKTFHRGATTYFTTHRPEHLVNPDTPKSTGEYLGNWPIDTSILHNGDGLTYAGGGCYWPQNKLQIAPGTPIFRNLDVAFQRQLMAKEACTRLLPVDLLFEETNDGFALSLQSRETDSAIRMEVQTAKEVAQNAERAEAVVRQQISKLGGTLLEAAAIRINWSQAYFLPASVLNDLRRKAVEAFMQQWSIGGSRLVVERTPQLSKQAPFLPAPIPEALMTCKYCILHELGCCKKKNPRKAGVPTYLRQQNLLLRITTDCAKCEMILCKA